MQRVVIVVRGLYKRSRDVAGSGSSAAWICQRKTASLGFESG